MAKQLLIYESAIPVSAERHADVSVEPSDSFAFSAEVNAAPLMAVEFMRASAEYAIVFLADSENLMPAVLLGVRNAQNLYLSQDAKWKAEYIPAFIRRYPFVFSSSDDGKRLTLCIDEAYPGFNREGRGNALFNSDKQPTAYVEKVLDFLKEYQAQFERTRQFCKRLQELDLLEPMQADVTTPAGERFSLTGFQGVNRDRMRKLDGTTLETLVKNDELELLYLHLASMRNFDAVKERLISLESAPAEPTPAPVAESAVGEPQTAS
jgi:hypothetical protein